MPHRMMPGEEKPKSRGTVYMVGKKAPAVKVGATVEARLTGTVESIRQDKEGYDVGIILSGAEWAATSKRRSLGDDMERAKKAKQNPGKDEASEDYA